MTRPSCCGVGINQCPFGSLAFKSCRETGSMDCAGVPSVSMGWNVFEQGCFGTVVSQSGSNQNVLIQALIGSAVDLACSLVREEEEGAVLADRTSQSSAKDIAPEHRSS